MNTLDTTESLEIRELDVNEIDAVAGGYKDGVHPSFLNFFYDRAFVKAAVAGKVPLLQG